MNSGKTVFAQLLQHLPRFEFNQCVLRYHGNHKVRSFSCLDQFLCMAFAQLTYRESLRDIITCLNSHKEKLYHMGFRGKLAKSTLADANELRDFRIYQDFGYLLINIASKLYQDEDLGLDLQLAVYALDSTVIDLCLSTFPWATFRKTKAAIKVHTLLNVRGSIPTFIFVTPASVHYVDMMDAVPFEADSVYTMDRAYLDFERAEPNQSAVSIFCHQEQEQHAAASHLLCPGGQNSRRSSRSDSHAPRLSITFVLSRPLSPSTLLRCRTKQAPGSSYEQLPYPGQDRRRYLSLTLAGGTVLQVDQTTSADQVVLRNISQCGQDPDMDCRQRLSSCGDCQEAIESSRQSPHNFTDFGGQPL